MTHKRYSLWLCCSVFAAFLLATCTTATAAPANDNFASAPQLFFASQMVRGNNYGATREPGEPEHGPTTGHVSVWWKFTVATNGYVTLSTEGSRMANQEELDTVLAVYTGPSLSQLIRVAANDDDEDADTLTSKVIFQVSKGTTYYVAVDGYSPQDMGIIDLSYSFSEKYPALPAPPWDVVDTYGNPFSSAAFDGQVVLLNFWATWCAPCIEEIPDLIALHEEYKDYGFSVVGVSVDSSQNGNPPYQLVENFIYDHGISYPVGLDAPQFSATDAFGSIESIPTTFIINREGNIVRKLVGSATKSQFEQMIKPLLSEPVPLKIEQRGDKVRVSWKTVPMQVTPQFSLLLTPDSWADMPTSMIVVAGETSYLEVNLAYGRRFFRLIVQ